MVRCARMGFLCIYTLSYVLSKFNVQCSFKPEVSQHKRTKRATAGGPCCCELRTPTRTSELRSMGACSILLTQHYTTAVSAGIWLPSGGIINSPWSMLVLLLLYTLQPHCALCLAIAMLLAIYSALTLFTGGASAFACFQSRGERGFTRLRGPAVHSTKGNYAACFA